MGELNGAGRVSICAEVEIVKTNNDFGFSSDSGQYNSEGVGACAGALSCVGSICMRSPAVSVSLFIICLAAGSGLGIRLGVGSVCTMERLPVAVITASINFVSPNGPGSLMASARNWCGGSTGATFLGVAELVFGTIPIINVFCFAIS